MKKKSHRKEMAAQRIRAFLEMMNTPEGIAELCSPKYRAEYEAGLDVDVLPNGTGDFGRDANNPIPVMGPQGEAIYLSRLVMLETECRVTFHRLGSVPSEVTEDIIDVFQVVGLDGKYEDTLYLDMYHPRLSEYVPEGYGLLEHFDGFTGLCENVPFFPRGMHQAVEDFTLDSFGVPLVSRALKKSFC